MTGDRGWAALDGRDNALNLIRLALAGMVLLAHGWDLVHGQHGWFPYAGPFAVDGFFILSGFLIAGSRGRSTLGGFLWRRFLRILPAFWACLIVTAFVAAPAVAAMHGDPFDWSSAATYVTSNALLLTGQVDVSDTLAGAAAPDWNPSLWTLQYEFGAYLIAGIALTWSRWRRQAAVGMFIAGLACVVGGVLAGSGMTATIGRLALFFGAGMIMRFELVRLPVSGGLAGVCAAVLAALFVTWNQVTYTLIAPVFLAYLLLWLGARLPIRLASRTDVSYGLYVYGAPVEQLLIAAGLAAALGPLGFAATAVLAVALVAWCSWLLVERPAMRMRSLSLAAPSTPRGAYDAEPSGATTP